MIAIVIAATQCIVAGLGAALLLEPSMTPRRLLGTAYLLGTGICASILLALSLLGIRWSATSFTLAFCIVAVALWLAARGGLSPRVRREGARRADDGRGHERGAWLAWVVDACTALFVIAHGVYASIVRGDVWDFWAIWGLKARVFFEHRGIDWRFLEHPYNAFAHPDYPPLLPLHFAHVTLLGGEWNERWLGVLTTLFGAALLFVVRDLFEEELQRPVAAALATLAVASPAFSMIGVGDGPMIAFGTAALLTIRRGSLAAGGVLLGLAAFTKNEGIVLVIAAALALGKTRKILRLWPAAAIAAPWLILRAVHSLPTDVVSGALSERLARNLAELPGALAATLPDRPLLWLAIGITLAVFVRELRSERFVLVAVTLQLLAYLAAYAVTPYDVHWHVRSSWPRLVTHFAVALAFVALLLSAREALRASDRRTRSAAG